MDNKKDFVIDIYPITIICDRYSGSFSGGKFTAWNLDYDCIPSAVNGGDIEHSTFFLDDRDDYVIGIGNTPNKALKDLIKKLNQNG